jgi:DNA helicase-2/ATP-dependent DNA helicase PcrA
VDILAALNPTQREAVEAIGGPLLILAGPGSGKTRVITHRIAYLIKVCGINPRRIMAVTFTNKAAREMEERLNRLVSSAAKELTLGTFHAICARFLRLDGRLIGVDSRYVIYDREDQLSLVKRALKEIELDPKQYVPSVILSTISNAKSQITTPEAFKLRNTSHFEEVVGRTYEKYQHLLEQNNALDFDDLLMKVVQLFNSQPEILKKYQQRYLHIMVDEFQDTNLVQYHLVKQLVGEYRNVCVVGDPDQSIYSWRSADLRNILSFEKDFPEARVVLLEQNYRSTKAILETASSIISTNKERKKTQLWTDNEQGELITIVETSNQQEEAQYVVSEVDRLLNRGEIRLADCVVMYRTNAQSRAIEEAFIRYGTPYKLVAGTRFYERREVKDIIAYLRLIHNQRDSVSLLRIINVPQRAIGERTLDQLTSWANSLELSQYQAIQLIPHPEDDKQLPFNPRSIRALSDFHELMEELIISSQELNLVDLFDLLIKKTGYKEYLISTADGEERWENVLELRTVARQYADFEQEEGLLNFLEGVTLVSDIDSYDESEGAVTLITLHQAKGLEFPIVFIIGLEEGILPHFRSFDDPAQMEEERRLCYVGVTRAKKRVYLVRAFRRNLMGSSTTNKPSRFLKDVPSHLVENANLWWGEDNQLRDRVSCWESEIPSISVDQPDLKAGDRVLHNQFGKGMVVSRHRLEGDSEVVVAFPGAGIKKLLQSFARLKKVE